MILTILINALSFFSFSSILFPFPGCFLPSHLCFAWSFLPSTPCYVSSNKFNRLSEAKEREIQTLERDWRQKLIEISDELKLQGKEVCDDKKGGMTVTWKDFPRRWKDDRWYWWRWYHQCSPPFTNFVVTCRVIINVIVMVRRMPMPMLMPMDKNIWHHSH